MFYLHMHNWLISFKIVIYFASEFIVQYSQYHPKTKVEPNKSKFMWVATSRRRLLIDCSTFAVSGADMKPPTCVRLLGVHIDDELSLKSQINKMVSTGFYQLWQIRAICRCLLTDTVKSGQRICHFTDLYRNDIHQSVSCPSRPSTACVQCWSHTYFRGLTFWGHHFSETVFTEMPKIHTIETVSICKAVNGMAPYYIKELHSCHRHRAPCHTTISCFKYR